MFARIAIAGGSLALFGTGTVYYNKAYSKSQKKLYEIAITQ